MYGEKQSSELGIKAVDEKTLQITLEEPCAYFLDICAFPGTFPVRQDIIEANGDQWTFDATTYIGNGPYKMTEWVHNSYIELAKNENYYDYSNLGLRL
jgi:oligopeptide transport system substrate-binding protein